jgi:hypothetical protein
MVKKTVAKKVAKPAALTSAKIKSLAGKGLKAPTTLTTEETRELAGSVLEHIKRKKTS